jgi:hypothetical protein
VAKMLVLCYKSFHLFTLSHQLARHRSYSSPFKVNDGLCFGVSLELTVLPTSRYLTRLSCIRRSQDRLGEMKALLNIIQSSVNKIEEALTANASVLPSTNAPFSLESESPLLQPSVQSAGALITSAAAQLMTLVRPAPLVISDIVMQVNRIIFVAIIHSSNNMRVTQLHVSAALRTAVSTHAAEILRDAGPKVALHILSGAPNLTLCFLRVYTYGKSPSRQEFILGSLVCIKTID